MQRSSIATDKVFLDLSAAVEVVKDSDILYRQVFSSLTLREKYASAAWQDCTSCWLSWVNKLAILE